jgi:hypothetical protein
MARKRRGPQSLRTKDRRGGPRPGAGRKRVLTEDQMIIIGGKCEQLWKAAAKRRAIERHEAKIDDLPALQTLHLSAKNIAHGTGSRRIGRIKAVSNERFEAFDADGCSLGLYPTRLEARKAIKRAAVDPITHDIDVEMEEHGGRYQSLSLKRPKGQSKRIIDEVRAWALKERDWVVSTRRVRASWVYFRQIESEASSDLSDEQ